jgi:hypothetical protein
MTLVQANARITVFGLGAALVGGGIIGAIIKVTGSYSAGLWVTAIAFFVSAFFAIRLPPQVDSAAPAPRSPDDLPARVALAAHVPAGRRIGSWARRGFAPNVIVSLQGESVLRFLNGLLTIFLAFYIESTRHGFDAAAALGGVLGAAGAGNFIGTAIGARIKLRRPDLVVIICTAIAAVTCILSAVIYSIDVAIFGMLLVASANALGKLALDALIQRDVPEAERSSAFGRSETFLQLAWVVGAAVACLVPSDNGSVGFWIGGAAAGAVSVVIITRGRAARGSV